MKFNSMRVVAMGAALATSTVTSAHPGHEPEDLLHALAHALASPPAILALLILAIAIALWAAHKARARK